LLRGCFHFPKISLYPRSDVRYLVFSEKDHDRLLLSDWANISQTARR